MILLPKYGQREIELAGSRCSLQGEYRIKRYDCMGKLNLDTGWRNNLITDLGMTQKGYSGLVVGGGWLNYMYLGSSAAAPLVTDTTMGAFLASSNSAIGSNVINSVPVSPNYEQWIITARRFSPGVGTSPNIREVGFGRDSSGLAVCLKQIVSPSISKAADETLDVYWRITQYPNMTDRNSSIVIDGITYNTKMRPLSVAFNPDTSGALGQIAAASYVFMSVSDQPLVTKTNTSLANIKDGGKSGDVSWNSSGGFGYQILGYKCQLASCNLANGIRTMKLTYINPITDTQIEFTAQTPTTAANPLCIPKDATKELTFYWRIDWVRH